MVGSRAGREGSTGPSHDSRPRRFAILEHHWSGVHWDFLVEDGEGLRTWAVDAPIVEGVELPARSLPAHRRIYLDYEGEISGRRGWVRRWDSGTCIVLAWDDDRATIEVRGSQVVGLVEVWRVREGLPLGWLFRLGKLS